MNQTTTGAIDVVFDVVMERLNRQVQIATLNETGDEGLKELLDFITYANSAIFFSAIETTSDIRNIWEDIRSRGDKVVGFMADVTSEVRFRLGHETMAVVVRELAKSMNAFTDDIMNNPDCVADVDVSSRVMSSERWERVLTSNPWLPIIVLIERAHFSPSDLLKLSSQSAA